jgi:membrane protease YdiL (CAAX protease family)
LLLALVRCTLLLPLFAVSKNYWVKQNFNYIWLFFSFVLLDQVVLYSLLNVRLVDGQRWNWAGKAGECILSLLFMCTTLLTKKEAGFTLAIKHAKKITLLIFAILLITFAIQYFTDDIKNVKGTETFLFQLLMPGIAEELVFRGILLGLLSKAYNSRFIIWKVPLGWGIIITSVLFGLVHAFTFGRHTFDFNILYFLSTFTMGLALAFIKEKSQSLLPGIVCHNLFNLIVTYV